MHKLSRLIGNEWVENAYPSVYAVENGRVTGGVSAGATVFDSLVSCLVEPIALLYVLHTPRGEAAAGRYQSPELGMNEVRGFIAKYADFLSRDARFDIWAHSQEDHATVVWDRHDHFFAYGPVQRFAAQLTAMGFHEGALASLGPHQHHYHAEFDLLANALLTEFPWTYSALLANEEQ